MKSKLLIEENIYEVVLTPENDHEREVLNLIESNSVETTLKVGNFSECQGGFIRYYPCVKDIWNKEHIDSLMIILKDKEPTKG
jgi:hypothetical protein